MAEQQQTPPSQPPVADATPSPLDTPQQPKEAEAQKPENVLDDVIAQAHSLKDEANRAFKEQDFKNAASTYELALDIFAQAKFEYRKRMNEIGIMEKIADCEKQMTTCYENCALCCLKQSQYQAGIQFSTQAIMLNQSSAKAYYLRGKMKRLVGDIYGAKNDLSKSLALKDSPETKKELDAADEEIEKHFANRKQQQQFFAQDDDDDDDDNNGPFFMGGRHQQQQQPMMNDQLIRFLMMNQGMMFGGPQMMGNMGGPSQQMMMGSHTSSSGFDEKKFKEEEKKKQEELAKKKAEEDRQRKEVEDMQANILKFKEEQERKKKAEEEALAHDEEGFDLDDYVVEDEDGAGGDDDYEEEEYNEDFDADNLEEYTGEDDA